MSDERIEVTLGKTNGTKVFASFQELETWLVTERSFWAWLGNPQQWTDARQVVSQRFSGFFDSIQGQLAEAQRIRKNAEIRKEAAQYQSCISSVQNFFRQWFENQPFTHSGTPLAKFVEQVRRDEGDIVASAVLSYSFRCPFNLNQPPALRGALLGYAFEAGLLERMSNESQALQEMRAEWEKKFQSFRDTLQVETDKQKQLNSDGAQLISKQETAFKELITKQDAALNDLVAKSKREWDELRKTYDDALALRSPVTYWTRKAGTHLKLAWAYAVVSIVASGVALYFLIPEVQSMMQPPKGIQDPDKWHPEYWRFAIVIASALFCVWVVRILVRLLLSNIHLQTDARERVTMVQTYLALLRRGKLRDDERMFILQTLFRPTPTGIVKDDAVPLTIVEGITKLGK